MLKDYMTITTRDKKLQILYKGEVIFETNDFLTIEQESNLVKSHHRSKLIEKMLNDDRD